MAEDNKGGGTFNQPKIGKRPLPKGSGDLKTNSQVFGLIGQQVMRINKLSAAVENSNFSLIEVLREEFDASHAIGEKQLAVYKEVNKSLLSINDSLLPFKQLSLELMEEGIGGSKTGTNSSTNATIGVKVTPSSGAQVEALEKKLLKLEKSLERLGGKKGGGGFLGGAALGGIAARTGGAMAGGAAGGTLGGAALGLLGGVGLGLAAITGALYLGAMAVDKFGTGLQNVATGLDALDKLDITADNFKNLNQAINNLTDDVSIRGARGLRIFSGAAFIDMAMGLEALNNTDLDAENFKVLQEAIYRLSTSTTGLGAIGLKIFSGVAFEEIARGMTVLSETDFDQQGLKDAADGLGYLMNQLDQFKASIAIQILSGADLKNLSEGLRDLDGLSDLSDLKGNLLNAGDAIGSFLLTFVDTERFFGSDFKDGAKVIERIGKGNALGHLADGIVTLSEIKNPDDASFALTTLGVGLSNLLKQMNYINVGAMKWLDSGSFKDVADGINEIMMFTNATKEVLNPDGTTSLVRNADLVASDFEEVGKALSSINDSVTYMGTYNLKVLAKGKGGFFGDNINVLNEVAEGLQSLQNIEDFDVDKFIGIGTALYTLVTAARGEGLSDVFQNESDMSAFDKYLISWDFAVKSFAGLFRNPLQDTATGFQLLGQALDEYKNLDENKLANFERAVPALKRAIILLQDKNIGENANFTVLSRFGKALDKINPNNLRAISELSESLGLAVRGMPITPDQVSALKNSVVSEILYSQQVNVMEGSTSVIDNTQITTPYQGQLGSYQPAVIHVSK